MQATEQTRKSEQKKAVEVATEIVAILEPLEMRCKINALRIVVAMIAPYDAGVAIKIGKGN